MSRKNNAEDEKVEKVETSFVQLRTSPENCNALLAVDQIKKEIEGKKDIYLSPADLTNWRLGYIDKHFPLGIDIRLLTLLTWQDSDAKNYMSKGIFKRLDLSDGKRGSKYNTRIETEESGRISDSRDMYFFEAYNDTLLVSCNLLAIDNDDDLMFLRHKNKGSTEDAKEYLNSLEFFFDKSIKGVLSAILSGEISEAKAHIYVNFIYQIVVEKNNSMYEYIVKYDEELKNTVLYFNTFALVKLNEVSQKQIEEIEKYL